MILPLLVPGIDPEAVVDEVVSSGTEEELCVSPSFSPDFGGQLIHAGFLLMSVRVSGFTFLLPKLHAERSILDFSRLHATRSASRLAPRYELRPDSDFESILGRCVEVHGDDWLTPELLTLCAALRKPGLPPVPAFGGVEAARFVSFGLYREGRLVAGEFGTIVGSVYTSYSGYRDEASSGTVQLILTAHWLRDAGFAFWDFGMPMEYKSRLGAVNLPRADFVRRFRAARAGRALVEPSAPGAGPGTEAKRLLQAGSIARA